MSADLHERLADLAGHTPPVSPPGDLWARGVRRRRVAVAGRVAVAVVLACLVGVGGWSWHQTRPIQPADTHGSPHLPDRFFRPSPWTHPFAGPPGQLVRVLPSQRQTLLHSRMGLVGVTASAGTYGFLEIPQDAALGVSSGGGVALSPDGRKVAFWTTGSPSGAPNTQMEFGVTITGVATYDAVTGRVHEHQIETEHGLDPTLLLWSDDERLVFGYAQILGPDNDDNASTSHYAATEVWQPGVGAPVPLSGRGGFVPGTFGTRATQGLVLSAGSGGHTWWMLDPLTGELSTFRTDRASDVLVPDPTHTRAVGVPGQNTDSGALMVVDLPSGSSSGRTLHFRTIAGGHGWVRPLAWVGRDHLAVLHRIVAHGTDGSRYVSGRIDLVDLRSGTSRPLVAEWGPHGTNESDPWLATGLLGAPLVHATAPPSPTSPRWVLWVGGLALVVLLVGWKARRGRRA
jgi:hypothetical protein